MIRKSMKPVTAILVLSIILFQPSAYGASIVSKTMKDQALTARAADLATARLLYATDGVATALAAEGLTPDQIQVRLAALSTADLISLGQNPAQIRSAGVAMTRKVWTIAGIAVGAIAAGAFALKQKDDGEDEDGTEDDGED